jgi:hypothetical protein
VTLHLIEVGDSFHESPSGTGGFRLGLRGLTGARSFDRKEKASSPAVQQKLLIMN